MRKLCVLGAVVALLVPVAARAKLTGDLRMCGSNGCRTLERHLGHDGFPILAELIPWPPNAAPARPAPYYRLTVVPLDSGGRPNPSAASAPMYVVPSARRTRSEDGRSGPYWSTFRRLPERAARAVAILRPFAAPRVIRATVGVRVAADANSYLRLYRLPSPTRRLRDAAGPRPPEGASTGEVARYWKRVQRLFVPIALESRRPSPWTDPRSSLWIGRTVDLIMRDGEIVPIEHSLADRVRRAQSLR